MLVAGVQTDTAELVCTVRGRRSVLAHREKTDQGGGEPLLLPKTERTSVDDMQSCFSTRVTEFKNLNHYFKALKPQTSVKLC